MNKKKLLKYAVDYLSKYDSSKKNLFDVLKRKIFKINLNSIEKKELINSINDIIGYLENNNLIDDNRYALSKINFLSNSGKSKKYISNYLYKKGLEKIVIQNNLIEFNKENYNWELNSAKKYAIKKNLHDINKSYEKRLGKLARAGFNYEICKKVLG